MIKLNSIRLIAVIMATAVFTFATVSAQPAKQQYKRNQISQADSYQMIKREPMKNSNAANQDKSSQTVVDIIDHDPSTTTLAKALALADLTSTLSDKGPFTIFVPNDAAFAKISPNKLADLLRPENKEKLIEILTYHVVPGKIDVADLKSGQTKTLNGKTVNVKVDSSDVTINGAKVKQTDIAAKNGVIHIIDTVLLP